MRWHALNALVRAYKPTVPLAALAAAAGFVPTGGEGGSEEAGRTQAGGAGRGPLPGRRTVVFEGDSPAARGEAEGLREAEAWALTCGAVLAKGECLVFLVGADWIE
jgi:hypothetical protein